jgi:hypothetical protein
MTTTWTMTVDCTDPAGQASFWCLALGYVPADPPKGWDSWDGWLIDQGVPQDEWNDGASVSDPDGLLPSISFLKVPEGRTVKNRLHLDLQVSGGRDQPSDVRELRIRTKAAELIDAGATVVHEAEQNGKLDHLWMADPEGNDFCVV